MRAGCRPFASRRERSPDDPKNAGREAARKLVGDLRAAITAGAKTFLVPPGEYRFGAAEAPNLAVQAAHDLSITAEGAQFWFDSSVRRDGISFSHCRNVSLSGGTVDFDPVCFTQGTIRAIDPQKRTLLVRIDPGYPLPPPVTPANLGKTKAVFFGPDGNMKQTMLDWLGTLDNAGGRDFTMGLKAGRLFTVPNDVRPGDRIALPERTGRMAVNVAGSENVTVEGLTIYAAPQMALVEEGGPGGNAYRRCKVVRRPGTNRLIACNADVFHSINVQRGPTIENCEFSYACDDLINVHALASLVWEAPAPDRVIVFSDHPDVLAAGAGITFYGFSTGEPLQTVRVTSVTPRTDLADSISSLPLVARMSATKIAGLGPNAQALELALDGPVAVSRLDFVFSDRATAAGTVIRGNDLHDTICRAVLLKAIHATVENNHIARTGLTGIMLATDRYFLEGPPPSDVAVRNNDLTDTALAVGGPDRFAGWRAAIAAWCDAGGREYAAISGRKPITNLRITDNRINGTPQDGILVADASGSSITGNVITGLGETPGKRFVVEAKPCAVSVQYCEGVTVEKNVLHQKEGGSASLLDVGRGTVNVGPPQR